MRVILPGSYDPVTLGHLDIIRRASAEFDEVFVVAFINPKKNYRFSVEDRVAMLMLATEELDNVLVSYSDGFVIDYMRDHGIEKIIKGYRTEADLPWEREQAEYNLKHGGYETELILCDERFKNISSTLVRGKIKSGESLEGLVPKSVEEYISSLK
jgi:pantetheine-phosphate adenylyltransferase